MNIKSEGEAIGTYMRMRCGGRRMHKQRMKNMDKSHQYIEAEVNLRTIEM